MFKFEGVKAYKEPFNYWVIENFLDPIIAHELLTDFPKPDSRWYEYDNVFEKKRSLDNTEEMPPVFASTLAMFNSRSFIEPLEKLTGIDGLIGDHWFRGGGLHQIMPGGHLDVHADFNVHPKLKIRRRLNAILYLNKGWEDSWGGHLELWEKDMSGCAVIIRPDYNRLVIFETNDDSFHGHPETLKCPDHMTRKSLALYYYSAADEMITSHSTLFQKRPDDQTTPEIEEFRKLRGTRAIHK